MNVTAKERPPRVITSEDHAAITALEWDNPHSTRLRRDVGDDLLRVAFRPESGCWVLGRLVPTQVYRPELGLNAMGVPALVPIIWAEWRADPTDSATAPLSIDDPRLGEYIRRCDMQRIGPRTFNDHLDAHIAAKRQAPIDAIVDQMTSGEALNLVKQSARARGVVGHRPTGPNAKRITSAGLWQRGASYKRTRGGILIPSA